MKANCELCKAPARIFCDSDQATLCWSCDAKVHTANFLVARHSRTLLCRTCLSPTPWNASGATLPSAATLCHLCAANDHQFDNQVVPWSSSAPPPSSSSSECSSFTASKNHHQHAFVSESETTATSSSKRHRKDDNDDPRPQEREKGWASKRRCRGRENRRG
ncbi:B-box domain protein 31-like isoform X2 [Cajanus cajan]|uniref:B-box domain protein 31-like isoform X1 n=1 Tax=Cajanus cajan TaxID=3821 RepID=UPI00098DB1DE|nr:B-box domain protein 31-like isoform X1 [Cajanus cajan]XP_020232401.1 B-box domain protein 31-like isoform X2 [Cajanus cajan]